MHPVRALLGQPRAWSAGPLGAVRTVPEILIMLNMIREGKGLMEREELLSCYGGSGSQKVQENHVLFSK